MTNNTPHLDRIIRRAEVLELTGLSKSVMYAHIAMGTFPKPVKISTRSVGWRESAIIGWQKGLSE
ncbi:AlpA family phage regulatory protein [Sphingomonas sp. IC-11]|nr:AlpA family phage regulatory protein [Sphingomonas sp. IC-11]MCD2316387.1 AlpA family phage regulatory protein [Sphingomonas sp. IC-11]